MQDSDKLVVFIVHLRYQTSSLVYQCDRSKNTNFGPISGPTNSYFCPDIERLIRTKE